MLKRYFAIVLVFWPCAAGAQNPPKECVGTPIVTFDHKAKPEILSASLKLSDKEKFLIRVINTLANKTVDEGSIVGGILLPGSIGDKVADAYRKHLFGPATLQDLPPDPPRFVINATNVQSGVLFRFSRPFIADYRVGLMKNPSVELAVAVAASSAFPPVLSPMRLEFPASAWEPPSGHKAEDLHREPFLTDVVLTDGGRL